MEQTTSTAAIRRRAILAASAAVIAGIATTETAQPVGATTNDTDFVAISNGTGGSGFRTQGSFRVGVSGVGTE